MSGAKVFFILLVLLVVAFIVVEVIGVGKNKQKTSTSGGTTATGRSVGCAEHPVLCGANSLLGSLSPSIDLTPKNFMLSSAKAGQDLTAAADPSHAFRKAEFTLQPAGCGVVSYTAPGAVPDGMPNPQTWPQPDDDLAKPAKMIVMKQGGKLSFHLQAGVPSCQVSLR